VLRSAWGIVTWGRSSRRRARRNGAAAVVAALAISLVTAVTVPVAGAAGGRGPVGSLDVARRSPGVILLAGWAAEPPSSTPIAVHVYVDGIGLPIVADRERPDVAAAWPGLGSRHGFDLTVPVAGDRTVCVFAVSHVGAPNRTLGCARTTSTPAGMLDAVTRPDRGGSARVRGWALDPDVPDSIPVHVYVDGIGRGVGIASRHRADIAAAFPGWGAAHGFDVTVPGIAPGARAVCVYAVNVGPGTHRMLGCRTVVISAPVDPSYRRIVLTPESDDSYGVGMSPTGTFAYAPPSNRGGNSRIAFVRAADAPSRDQETCATWAAQSDAFNQQGAALRVSVQPGARRAITVTKNIAFGAHWVFNVHVWDSRTVPMFHHIAKFDLGPVFRPFGVEVPLPWSLCARAVGGIVQFVAWRAGQPRPGWGDPNQGGSVLLPPGWETPGVPGWYVGHLRPGDISWFVSPNARPLAIPSAQAIAPTSARQPTNIPHAP
jgi:hypothetical protein